MSFRLITFQVVGGHFEPTNVVHLHDKGEKIGLSTFTRDFLVKVATSIIF